MTERGEGAAHSLLPLATAVCERHNVQRIAGNTAWLLARLAVRTHLLRGLKSQRAVRGETVSLRLMNERPAEWSGRHPGRVLHPALGGCSLIHRFRTGLRRRGSTNTASVRRLALSQCAGFIARSTLQPPARALFGWTWDPLQANPLCGQIPHSPTTPCSFPSELLGREVGARLEARRNPNALVCV